MVVGGAMALVAVAAVAGIAVAAGVGIAAAAAVAVVAAVVVAGVEAKWPGLAFHRTFSPSCVESTNRQSRD